LMLSFFDVKQVEHHPLPTFLGRRQRRSSSTGRVVPQKRSCTKTKRMIRTIICIPRELAKFVDDAGDILAISIPRGRARSDLFSLGLVGKLEIISSWNEQEMHDQISEMFADCFSPIPGINTLQFHYLTNAPGMKVLQRVKVNASFSWDGTAVQANSRGNVYILTDSRHILIKDINSNIAKEVSYHLDVLCN